MFSFSCPRCSRAYQADETHLGKNIRCTQCGDIVPIAFQDGRSSRSTSPIEIVHGKPAGSNRPAKPSGTNKRAKVASSKRLASFIAAAPLCAVLGYICFLVVTAHREPAPSHVADYSPQTLDQDNAAGRQPLQADSRNEPAPVSLDPSDVDITSGLIAGQAAQHARSSNRDRNFTTAKSVAEDATLHARNDVPPVVNGSRVVPDLATAGHGQLEAINGTDHDAYVLVVDPSRDLQVRWVLIRRGARVTLEHLDPGAYRVVFSTGLGWDQTTRRFNADADYFQMGKDLSFEEARNAEETRYECHSITLYPVPDGNVRLIHLSEAQFRALSGKQ